jgi:hypothetical protein
VAALQDTNGDGRTDQTYEIRGSFGTPNGMDIHDGTPYIVDEHRVLLVPGGPWTF